MTTKRDIIKSCDEFLDLYESSVPSDVPGIIEEFRGKVFDWDLERIEGEE